MARQTRGDKTPERKHRTKYSEEVKAACLCALLTADSFAQVTKRYGVPESTLRAWRAKAEHGENGLWTRAREEQSARAAVFVAEGARLAAELLCRRLKAGARNLARCEQIDRMLLGSEESGGLVLQDGMAVDEARERILLAPELEERLRSERKARAKSIPSDAALGTMLRALASVSEKGGRAWGTSAQAAPAKEKDPFEEVKGEEW